MARSKTTENYKAEAKKLLAWWQESLHNQMKNPDMLNAWFASMQHAAASNQPEGNKPHASKRRTGAASHEPDAHDAIKRELRALKSRVAKLERALAAATKPSAKRTGKRKPHT